MKFRIGDIVKVIDTDRQYITYVDFIKDNLPEKLNDFKVGRLINDERYYRIILIKKHPLYDERICVIEDLHTKQIFMIKDIGLEVVKKDYIKLENIIVHCNTKEKATMFLKECERQGMVIPSKNSWEIYEEETAYYVKDGLVQFSPCDFYIKEGYCCDIIDFDELFKEEVMKLKIGDRVIHKKFGKGIVKFISKVGMLGVRFDKFNILLHSLEGNCENCHGFYCHEHELTKIDNALNNPKECKTYEMPSYVDDKNVDKIIINEPCVIVFANGYKGVAKCCPEDIFDEEIGYNIAHQRALIQSLEENIGDEKCFLNGLIK